MSFRESPKNRWTKLTFTFGSSVKIKNSESKKNILGCFSIWLLQQIRIDILDNDLIYWNYLLMLKFLLLINWIPCSIFLFNRDFIQNKLWSLIMYQSSQIFLKYLNYSYVLFGWLIWMVWFHSIPWSFYPLASFLSYKTFFK